MINIVKKRFFIYIFLIYSNLYSSIIVNTDILLVKKMPIDSSKTIKYYKKYNEINYKYNIIYKNNIKWLQLKDGFIKEKYIIYKNNLPKLLKINDINTDNYVIQLVTYKNPDIYNTIKTRVLLKNEKNIFLRKTDEHIIFYLVNFKSISVAKKKSAQLMKLFPNNYIRKIKKLLPKDKNNIFNLNFNKENENKIINNKKDILKSFLYKDKIKSVKKINYTKTKKNIFKNKNENLILKNHILIEKDDYL